MSTPLVWDATVTARPAPQGGSTATGSFGEFMCRACIATGGSPAPLAESDGTWPSRALLLAEKRQAEAARIRDKYPDRIPVRLRVLGRWIDRASLFGPSLRHSRTCPRAQVIVEKADKSDIPDIDKKKCGRVPVTSIICVWVAPPPPLGTFRRRPRCLAGIWCPLT